MHAVPASMPASVPASVPFRLARAAVLTAVCLGLSTAAHRFAGGAVSAPGAAGGTALAFAAALAAAGRERPAAVILPLLAGLQAALHLLFSLSHPMPSAEAAGHVHSGLVPGLGMLVVHGWAVGLTALWLARGEAALWALLRRLPVRLRLLAAYAVPDLTPFFAVPAAEPAPPRPAGLRHAMPRRGPPPRLAAAS
ncbi:MFS transporter [Planomonospora sp. ID82291]|uniref:MFS transporter n=1 Tax=Planomonospora sp. ID82291 TaxID=2738136 RepID=UPI0018C44DC9|nr:MFS transporter [Planomonospora sp. ID82291]MBG0817749.1 MFS transporter [Planomonospora sp. ID82291]